MRPAVTNFSRRAGTFSKLQNPMRVRRGGAPRIWLACATPRRPRNESRSDLRRIAPHFSAGSTRAKSHVAERRLKAHTRLSAVAPRRGNLNSRNPGPEAPGHFRLRPSGAAPAGDAGQLRSDAGMTTRRVGEMYDHEMDHAPWGKGRPGSLSVVNQKIYRSQRRVCLFAAGH
jgi:hypothetical protein